MDRQYVDAVRLLLMVAPVIFESPRFALKGGTALNLFVQDLLRLSVDIDVAFTDHAMERESALIAIGNDLQKAKAELERMGYSATIRKTQKGDEAKLLVADQSSQIKVEVNFVFRGTLLPVELRTLVSSARNLFTTAMELPVLAIPELYGSKLVAALDRQHPRDWSLMSFEHLKDMPAIRWKLFNLEKLRTTNKTRFEFQATELMDRFDRFPQ